jgi:signal transduction histidine kinase
VHADRQRLAQVLLNLLSNAIKYNRPRGRVRMTCTAVAAADAAGDRIALRVEDTGPGIPAEKLAQLFTPFARLGAEQTEVEGTGLGLALSQRLAEAMGGTLTLERSGLRRRQSRQSVAGRNRAVGPTALAHHSRTAGPAAH